MFVRELPADAVIDLELLFATSRQLTHVSNRHTVQIVIFDDNIIPINNIAIFVNGSRMESLGFKKALCISLLEDMRCHILIGQTAIGKHTGAECIDVFSLGLLAPFFHFGRFGGFLLWLRIKQYIEFARQIIACIQELHVFRPLQIVQRFLALYIRATEAFENLFGWRDMQLLLSMAFRAFAFIFTTSFPQFMEIADYIKEPALRGFLDSSYIILSKVHKGFVYCRYELHCFRN